MTVYVKAINGGRVHALSDRWNRFGQLTLCGKVVAAESARFDEADCRACRHAEAKERAR